MRFRNDFSFIYKWIHTSMFFKVHLLRFCDSNILDNVPKHDNDIPSGN